MKGNTHGGNRPQPEEGQYGARCIGIVDLGTQETTFKGQKKHVRQVMFFFELIGTEAIFDESKGPQPFVMNQKFTLSFADKANLRKFLKQWRNKDMTEEEANNPVFMKTLLGKPVYLSITITEKDGKSYRNISTVMKYPTNLPKLAQPVNELFYFDMDMDVPGNNPVVDFSKLYNWVQDVIKKSPEYAELNGVQGGGPVNGNLADQDADF